MVGKIRIHLVDVRKRRKAGRRRSNRILLLRRRRPENRIMSQCQRRWSQGKVPSPRRRSSVKRKWTWMRKRSRLWILIFRRSFLLRLRRRQPQLHPQRRMRQFQLPLPAQTRFLFSRRHLRSRQLRRLRAKCKCPGLYLWRVSRSERRLRIKLLVTVTNMETKTSKWKMCTPMLDLCWSYTTKTGMASLFHNPSLSPDSTRPDPYLRRLHLLMLFTKARFSMWEESNLFLHLCLPQRTLTLAHRHLNGNPRRSTRTSGRRKAR